jgi:hypothetical protein
LLCWPAEVSLETSTPPQPTHVWMNAMHAMNAMNFAECQREQDVGLPWSGAWRVTLASPPLPPAARISYASRSGPGWTCCRLHAHNACTHARTYAHTRERQH